MKKKPKQGPMKPNDREVVAIAQFHTGAGPMKDKRKDPKQRRMQDRQEEKKVAQQMDE